MRKRFPKEQSKINISFAVVQASQMLWNIFYEPFWVIKLWNSVKWTKHISNIFGIASFQSISKCQLQEKNFSYFLLRFFHPSKSLSDLQPFAVNLDCFIFFLLNAFVTRYSWLFVIFMKLGFYIKVLQSKQISQSCATFCSQSDCFIFSLFNTFHTRYFDCNFLWNWAFNLLPC